jgi:hypothetical protein
VSAARCAGEDVTAGLGLARKYGTQLPLPGGGSTAVGWRLLAEVAAQDLTVGRILEAHSLPSVRGSAVTGFATITRMTARAPRGFSSYLRA